MYKTFTTLAALLLFASNAALAAPSVPMDRRGPSSVQAREGAFDERSKTFVDKREGAFDERSKTFVDKREGAFDGRSNANIEKRADSHDESDYVWNIWNISYERTQGHFFQVRPFSRKYLSIT